MDGTKYNDVLSLIKSFRDCFPNAVEICTKGKCIQFALILNNIYKEGEIYWDEDHAHFVLDGHHFDITGEVKPSGEPIENYGILKIQKLLRDE